MGSRGKQDTSRALLGRPRVAEVAANRYTDTTQVSLVALPQSCHACVYTGEKYLLPRINTCLGRYGDAPPPQAPGLAHLE